MLQDELHFLLYPFFLLSFSVEHDGQTTQVWSGFTPCSKTTQTVFTRERCHHGQHVRNPYLFGQWGSSLSGCCCETYTVHPKMSSCIVAMVSCMLLYWDISPETPQGLWEQKLFSILYRSKLLLRATYYVWYQKLIKPWISDSDIIPSVELSLCNVLAGKVQPGRQMSSVWTWVVDLLSMLWTIWSLYTTRLPR